MRSARRLAEQCRAVPAAIPMTPRFFVDVALAAPGRAELEGAPAHHAANVLRLRAGALLELFNGDGYPYRARLVALERGRCQLEVLSRGPQEPPAPMRLVLAQGLASSERMDWIVEKAVELGVARLVPVQCARSVARLAPERAARRVAHWRQIVIAACMQCGRNRLPELAQPIAFERFVASGADVGSAAGDADGAAPVTRLVLVPDAERRLVAIEPPRGPVTLLIGPESGLSPAEIALAGEHGFVAVRLGPRTLRTETAGVSALAALQSRFGDF